MKKKQYIAPYMIAEPLACVQTILWASGEGPEPGSAPARQGDGSKVKLTKMYI